MERPTSSEISALGVNISGGSAPPTPGGPAPPTPGGLDIAIPPDVLTVVRYIFEGVRCSETVLRELAALYIKHTAKWDELALHGDDAEYQYAERAREGRRNDVLCFPYEYLFDNDTMDERKCIWRQGSGLWLLEKSSGIMWVAVHGADTICVVTKKGDLDRGRLRGDCFKLIPEEEVLALFRKLIICEIEDLVDPAPELRHNLQESIKKPSGVDHVDLSTALRQKLQESIKKPFGVVSAKSGINNICNESGNEASSAVCYEEKAIEFLNEKMNRHTLLTLDETIKTAVCAFQCLFPKKLKATEIEVSVMDPKYRVDDPKYRVDPEDEFADRTLWEVPTDEYEKYLDAVDEFGPGEIEEPLIIPKKLPLETQGSPPAG